MKILRAEKGDIGQILSIRASAHMEYYPNPDLGITPLDVLLTEDYHRQEKIQTLAEKISDPANHLIEVLMHSGDLVGYLQATKNGDSRSIDFLHLLAPYRRHGEGIKLANQAIGWLGNENSIDITVVPYNTAGIGFSKNLGFEATGEAVEASQLISGAEVPHISMRRAP